MSEIAKRRDVLDLLARGKIGIDEAIELLAQSGEPDRPFDNEPVYKAETVGEEEIILSLKQEEVYPSVIDSGEIVKGEQDPPQVKEKINNPRWLRIRVANLENQKTKVSINVPLAMVKFGLGVARAFSPVNEGANLDEINDILWGTEQSLLVDVEDAERNEHVQIYLD